MSFVLITQAFINYHSLFQVQKHKNITQSKTKFTPLLFEGYSLQVRHKQDWGQRFILLLPYYLFTTLYLRWECVFLAVWMAQTARKHQPSGPKFTKIYTNGMKCNTETASDVKKYKNMG